ncbi:hypothetical protein [Methanocaldococcus infernus]
MYFRLFKKENFEEELSENKVLFVEVKWRELSAKEIYGIFKDLERNLSWLG